MRVVDLKEWAAELEERKRALGIDRARFEAARNNGTRRTPEKRALLQALADEARRQGRKPSFEANF